MPISITPISAAVLTSSEVSCDSLYINSINVDARTKVSPTARMVVLPYASNSGVPIYAAENQQKTFSTSNLYGAIANIPEMGTAMGAIFAAGAAWNTYLIARQTDLTIAQGVSDTAKTDLANAQATVTTDQAAYTVAQAASNASPSDSGLAASTATALTNLNTAKANVVIAQTAVQTTQANLRVAQLAANDPANPPLVP